jgi:hypothetical protein
MERKAQGAVQHSAAKSGKEAGCIQQAKAGLWATDSEVTCDKPISDVMSGYIWNQKLNQLKTL